MKSCGFFALCGLALLTACTDRQPKLVSTPYVKVANAGELPAPELSDSGGVDAGYAIGPGDRLTVTVFGIENLGQKAQVDGAGNINLPLIGTVKAAGRTTADLQAEVTRRLRAAYVRNPQVAVNLEEANSQIVSVDGSVKEPGAIPIMGRTSLMQVIARAKGTSEYAKLEDVVVFRTVGGQRMAALYNLAAIRRGLYADPQVYAGDIVIVGDSPSRRLFRDLVQAAPLLSTPLIVLLN